MCSRTLGPATVPSLVTWPTIKKVIPASLARRRRTPVVSLTWETDPAADWTEEEYMVWMESTTQISGFVSSRISEIVSRSVSQRKVMLSPNSPTRLALRAIWRRDSSPEM